MEQRATREATCLIPRLKFGLYADDIILIRVASAFISNRSGRRSRNIARTLIGVANGAICHAECEARSRRVCPTRSGLPSRMRRGSIATFLETLTACVRTPTAASCSSTRYRRARQRYLHAFVYYLSGAFLQPLSRSVSRVIRTLSNTWSSSLGVPDSPSCGQFRPAAGLFQSGEKVNACVGCSTLSWLLLSVCTFLTAVSPQDSWRRQIFFWGCYTPPLKKEKKDIAPQNNLSYLLGFKNRQPSYFCFKGMV